MNMFRAKTGLAALIVPDRKGLRELTLCKVRLHCRRRNTVVKWDGGRMAHLCPHCRLILWWER